MQTTEFRIHPLIAEATRESLWLVRYLRQIWSMIQDDRERFAKLSESLRSAKEMKEQFLAADLSLLDPHDPNGSLYKKLYLESFDSARLDLAYWYKSLPPAATAIGDCVASIRSKLKEAGLAAEKDAAALLARVQRPESFAGYSPQAWETLIAIHLGERVAQLLRESFVGEVPDDPEFIARPWEVQRAVHTALNAGDVIGRTIRSDEELARLEAEISRDFAELDRVQSRLPEPGVTNDVLSVGAPASSLRSGPQTSRGGEVEGGPVNSLQVARRGLEGLRRSFEDAAVSPCPAFLTHYPELSFDMPEGWTSTPADLFTTMDAHGGGTIGALSARFRGAVSQKWRREFALCGDEKIVNRLLFLSTLASRCVAEFLKAQGFRDWVFRYSAPPQELEEHSLWVTSVYELAWQEQEGSPLIALRKSWCPRHPHCTFEMGQGGDWYKPLKELILGGRASEVVQDADRCGWWYSRLEDFALASTHCIDLILGWLMAEQHPVAEAGSFSRSGQPSLDTQSEDSATAECDPEPLLSSPSGRVQLFGAGESPVVDGVRVDRLTRTRYDVVAFLIRKGADGAKKKELESVSGDAVNVLKKLAKIPGWNAVVALPGVAGHGYRIH